MLTWLKSWDTIVFNKPFVQKQMPSMFSKNTNSSLNKFKQQGQNNYQ